MKSKYLIFASKQYDMAGGWGDFYCAVDEPGLACRLAWRLVGPGRLDWAEVVNTERMAVQWIVSYGGRPVEKRWRLKL